MLNDFTSDIQYFADGMSVVGTAGNDVVNGFTENDTLFFDGGAYSTDSGGKNVVANVGDGRIVLDGTANLADSDTTEDDIVLAESFVTFLQRKTEAGYPVIAGLFFQPHEYHGFENLDSSYYVDSETLTIDSSDGLELTAYHYTPENPNDKWVILVHGYGHNHKHMNGFAQQYLANNYHVLMVDQRAAGDSEGEWLTMSAAEGEDVALWTHKIAELNPDAKITLHGVSMGAATAMLAAANSNLTNVTSLIEDCGYTRVLDLVDLAKGLIPELGNAEFINLVNNTSESLTGYKLTAASPIDSLGNATMPSMFITGTADQVINPAMLESLYSASGAEVKEIFTVAGATHGLSGLKDSIGYGNAVFRFNAEAAGEGWITSNVTDRISLRGTKYGDTITNSGNYVTITGGKGKDSINNYGSYSVIYGGDGNDKITNESENSTILGGNGNDSIINNENTEAVIKAGKGNDYIFNSHAYYPTLEGGAGKDKIVVARGHHIYINGGSGNDTILGDSSADWAMGGYAVIKGGKGNDYINPIYSDSSSIQGGDGNDTIINEGYNTTLSGGKGDDVISLQGASIEGSVVRYDMGDGNDIIYGFNENTSIRITSGEKYSLKDSSDDVILKIGENKLTIVGGKNLSKINVVNYEITPLNISNSKNNTLITGTELSDTIENSGSNVTIDSAQGKDTLTNSGKYVSLNGSAGDDTLSNSGKNSTIVGAEGDDDLYNTGAKVLLEGGYGNDWITSSGNNVTINPGVGFDSISIGGKNVVIDYVGGSDTIKGVNDTTMLKIDGDFSESDITEISKDVYISHGDYTLLLEDARLSTDRLNINGMTYLLGNKIRLPNDDNEVTISRSNVSVIGGTGNDTINILGSNNKIYGNAGNDSIVGNASNDYLSGGKGNDTLTGGKGKDTIYGGAGNDSIVGNASNDYLSGGKGNDTLTGGKGKDTIYGGAGNDSIVGNAGNDYLSGGNGNDYLNGGNGNDTLTGGKGNDTLTGKAGKDIFIHSAGKDVITDYTAGQDKIKITSGKISKATVSGKNVIFTVGKGTITVKNGKGKKITTVDANGKRTTKSYTKTVSLNTSKLWFAEENNFVTSDNLSEITKNNLTPSALEKITTNNFENLTQENNFVTFSDK